MVRTLKPFAYGMTAAMLLCGTAFIGTAGAAGQKADQQQQVQQKPAAQSGTTNGATNGRGTAKKAPVGSPRTYTNPERLEARVAELEKKLRITPQQKPQWDNVVAAMRANADAIEDVIQHRRQNAGRMSALEDMRSYQALSEKHAEGMETLVAAFEPLYQGLSPEQKKVADEEFTSYRKRVSSTATPPKTQ
ncbi:MAG: Spy/CpxP family protein refolding chaperone [Alphaproteobacteria bacterium]|nr:Spy/CpxP family protein refolding chaperone [Alphaproteobacteria bacterium]